MLKRVVMRGSIDPNQQRITLEQGDLGTKELGARRTKASRSRCPAGSTTARSRALRSASPAIRCRRRDEAAVAVLPRAEGARLGGGARRQRKRRAHGHRDQCDVGAVAAQRPADARRGAVDRDRRQRRDAAAGRRTARDPRRRSQRARQRPHGEGDARQGHRRCFAGPQADALQRRVRGAEPPHQDAAGARAASASRVRLRQPPNCSRSSGFANSPARRSIPPARGGRSRRR